MKYKFDVDRKDFYYKDGENDRTKKRLTQLAELGMKEVGVAEFGVPGITSGLYIERVWNYNDKDWDSLFDWVSKLIEQGRAVLSKKKLFSESEVKGKFIIAYDTLCDGLCCSMDEDDEGNRKPALFDSDDEAFAEIFDANCCILESHLESNLLEDLNEGVTPEIVAEMRTILNLGDVKQMREFMDKHPDCDDSGEFVESAETFLYHRKAFFPSGIVGKKLVELTSEDLED